MKQLSLKKSAENVTKFIPLKSAFSTSQVFE